MRQRKIRNLSEKLRDYEEYLVDAPEAMPGTWRAIFPDANPNSVLAAEIGCGKGKFLAGMAFLHPDWYFIGIEQNESAGFHALEKAKAKEIPNAKYVLQPIKKDVPIFREGELDRIYLNFSDPWPKARHAKRRLTAPGHLASYVRYLKDGGILEFRTDNVPLFEYSVEMLEEQPDMEILECTRDFHGDHANEAIVTTEYEDKFAGAGKNICFVQVQVHKSSDSLEEADV